MRTKVLLGAALLAAGLASSMAQSNVYSLNVVGYVNRPIPGAGKYSALANPLNGTSNTLGGLLTATLPTGSQVLKFNPAIGDYDVFTRTVFAPGWSPAAGATTTLNVGEGVLIKTAVTSPNLTNTFVGEVLQGTLTKNLQLGYNLIGNMVPDSGLVTSLQLTNVPNGSQLLKMNVAIQDFDVYTKVIFAPFWTGPGGVPNIDVADGFFIKASGAFAWVRNFTVQ